MMGGWKSWKAFPEERSLEPTKREQLHINACGFTIRCSIITIMGVMFLCPHTFGHEVHVFFKCTKQTTTMNMITVFTETPTHKTLQYSIKK